jgi:Hyaluronidase protein (HylP)
MTNPISVTVSSGVAISAKSTSSSTTTHDHVGVFNLDADGGTNAGLNVVSRNTAFSACEITGHETARGTLKISHVNPGTDAALDANAAAISIDLQASTDGGSTAAQGIFLKSTTGRTSGKIINYVDRNGATIFALLPDGSLLLTPLPAAPAGTNAGLKLCNVKGRLGVVDSAGNFIPLT